MCPVPIFVGNTLHCSSGVNPIHWGPGCLRALPSTMHLNELPATSLQAQHSITLHTHGHQALRQTVTAHAYFVW
jgi:hypothetical protein